MVLDCSNVQVVIFKHLSDFPSSIRSSMVLDCSTVQVLTFKHLSDSPSLILFLQDDSRSCVSTQAPL